VWKFNNLTNPGHDVNRFIIPLLKRPKVKVKPIVAGWLVLVVFLSACHTTSSRAPASLPVRTMLPPAYTTELAPTTSSDLITPPANETASPTAWPPALTPEEDLSRNPVTGDEQATFDRLDHSDYVQNDPIALAIAVRGVPGPVNPVVSTTAPTLQPGIVESFWISNNDTNQWSQIQARLERVTEHAYLWFDISHPLRNTSTYDKAAQAFEQMYRPDRAVYGSEWNPGVDGDPHVYVVHSAATAICAVTEANTNQCRILGYFSSTDELPAAVEPHSNQHEMFVMNIDAGGLGGQDYLLTLAHEFRHMIEYNYDRHDDGWEVEGTAMMAEDLLGYPRVPGRYGNNFTGNTDLQLNTWSEDNAIPHYGQGYIFSRYIFQRFGQEFYTAWVQNPDRGFFALDTVLKAFGIDLDAHTLWLNWTTAVSLLGFKNVPTEYSFGDGFYVNPTRLITVNSYPKTVQQQVDQYGFETYDIRSRQPVQVNFTGTTKSSVIPGLMPASGNFMWWSGRANQSDIWLTRAVDLTGVPNATLYYSVYHNIERGYDYAYVLVSTDEGQTWKSLPAPHMQGADPVDNPAGSALTDRFYTGDSSTWVDEKADLTSYAGKKILLRFEYITDAILTDSGLALDNIAIPEIGFYDDVESSSRGWRAQGFNRVSAYMDQRFDLILISFSPDGQPTVRPIIVGPDHQAVFDIPFNSQNQRALLIVAASNPLTLTTASYQLDFNK
jgi:immune inhibitor A